MVPFLVPLFGDLGPPRSGTKSSKCDFSVFQDPILAPILLPFSVPKTGPKRKRKMYPKSNGFWKPGPLKPVLLYRRRAFWEKTAGSRLGPEKVLKWIPKWLHFQLLFALVFDPFFKPPPNLLFAQTDPPRGAQGTNKAKKEPQNGAKMLLKSWSKSMLILASKKLTKNIKNLIFPNGKTCQNSVRVIKNRGFASLHHDLKGHQKTS